MAKKKTKKAEPKPSLCCTISKETWLKARSVVSLTPRMTMSSLVDAALVREITRLEKKRGEPYPTKPVALVPGRPMKF